MNLKNITWMLCLLIMPFLASCSWEELPAYEEADITGVQFYYRWASTTDKDPITGEPMVREQRLNAAADINNEAGTISVTVSLPGANATFTEEVRNSVTTNNLVCQVSLSTAARIAPADGNKVLGVPDDWSKPHEFVVTAADGTKKKWTITITNFEK